MLVPRQEGAGPPPDRGQRKRKHHKHDWSSYCEDSGSKHLPLLTAVSCVASRGHRLTCAEARAEDERCAASDQEEVRRCLPILRVTPA